MRSLRPAIGLFAVLLVAACGGDDNGGNNGGTCPDLTPPAGAELKATPGGFTYPSGPYGIQVNDTFEDFTLNDCDNNPVTFAQILADAELVLFNVGAGWCQPCIDESETMDADIFKRFAARGLRVVQVVYQDEDSKPATSLFCEQWRCKFGLSFPVLKDPLFDTQIYFQDPAAQTPLNLLVDKNGVIVFREVGTPAAGLDATIDSMLP